MTVLRISAVCLVDDSGRLLTVRKRGTTMFMQPGGKLEPGETPEAAAIREIEEEIGLTLAPADLTYMGRFDALAANEADTRLDAHVYLARLPHEITVRAEIEEQRYLTAAEPWPTDIAPLLRDHILPILPAIAPHFAA